MTFGGTLVEHLTMAASANIFYIAIDNKNKTNIATSIKQKLKYISRFQNSGFL